MLWDSLGWRVDGLDCTVPPSCRLGTGEVLSFSCNVNGDMNRNCLFVHHLLNFSPSQIYMGH